MKFKIVLLVTLIVAVGLLIGASYDNYRHHKVIVKKNQETIQQADVAVTNARKTVDETITKYNALWEQCQKGIAAYNLLSNANKIPSNMPNCGLSILQ